jgi:hypothetical protein
MNAIKFNQSYYRNLFKNTLIPFGSVVLTNGTATFENDSLVSVTGKSLKVNVGSFQTSDVNFNFDKILNTNAETDINHFFSFGVKSEIAFTLVASVVINGAEAIEMNCNVESGITGFQTFGQIFQMNRSDSFVVSFKVLHDTEAVSNSMNFNIDAFCLEPNVNDNFLPKGYVNPDNATGYQSRVDEFNTVSLTASTENTVVITGTVEENGGLILMDSNSKITPINVGDVVQIDFACTFVTPAGSNNYVVINLSVDGSIYRSLTHELIKGSGNDDTISISWCLPVGDYFKLNGALITINPNATMTYKNRYIQVTRIHKAR